MGFFIIWLYCRTTPTFSIAWWTIGAKAAASSSVLCRFEIVAGRSVSAGKDPAGIAEGHMGHGAQEDLLGFGHGLLGGTVHSHFQASTCEPMPIRRSVLPAVRSFSGNRILMASFKR